MVDDIVRYAWAGVLIGFALIGGALTATGQPGGTVRERRRRQRGIHRKAPWWRNMRERALRPADRAAFPELRAAGESWALSRDLLGLTVGRAGSLYSPPWDTAEWAVPAGFWLEASRG